VRGAQCRAAASSGARPLSHAATTSARDRRPKRVPRPSVVRLARLCGVSCVLTTTSTPHSCSSSMSDISSQLHGGYAHDLTRAWSAQSSSLTKSMFMLPRACPSRRPPSLFLYRH